MNSVKSGIFNFGSLKFFLASALIMTFSAIFAGEPGHDKHASENVTHEKADAPHGEENGKKKFDAGKMIIEHITDAHDWHVTTIGEHHYSIPLPIILYSKTKGFDVFSSSRFDHGHKAYNGYKLEGNKVVAVNADGTPDTTNSFYDISITKNAATMMISVLLMCLVFITVARTYSRNPGKAPKGLQGAVEPLIIFIRDDVAKASIGPKYQRYMPFLLTVFFFIWFGNLLGLIPFFPGGANLTGNIAVTLVLALLTFVITMFSTTKYYWIHVFNTPGVPWWLKFPIPLMPVVEFMGVLTKPFVLMVRLFANITAGHIIILGFFSLIFIFGEMNEALGWGVSVVSVAFTLFMSFLELLVAFLQAYVFTLLSALYFGGAVEDHSHAHEGDHH
jgi:F-type H+-transporting ATPase subunit a